MRAALPLIALLLAACNAAEEEGDPPASIEPTSSEAAPIGLRSPSRIAAKASEDVDAATREAAEAPDTP